jgi:hypothetical protein
MLPDLRWPKPSFKTAALNHSDTFHGRNFNHLTDFASATETKNWRWIGTGKTVFVLMSFGGATNSPQRSFPDVGYLVQEVLHARGLR